MGNTSSSSGHKLLLNQSEPLTFHDTHSEHIRLYNGGRTAKRVESFCKGICFSARPIGVGELVSIRCSDISTNWSGFLRIGFTANNPATLNAHTLPRYACPDMTNQPGNWAKALPERFGIVNYVITYFVNRQGDVYIALNGENLPGPFFCGVNVSSPLWALIDIYGNATGVEFLDKSHLSISPSATPALISEQGITRKTRKSTAGSLPPPTSIPVTSPSKHHPRVTFQSLHFHEMTGKFVALNPEKTVATRHVAEYANAYVFCERPIALLEKIVIQVVGMDMSYTGGLTVGMTSCDPSTLNRHEFPDDSDQLLDRPEYWVVHKDVVTNAEVGDELSFTMSNDGEIQFSRNSHAPVVIMHVDKTIPMWMFWDLYGQFNQIKLFGVVGSSKAKSRGPPVPPPPLSVKPQLQHRSLSVMDTPSPPPSSSLSLTVELPIKNLNISGAPPIPPRLQRSNTVAATGSVSPNSDNKVGAAAMTATPVQEEDESADNMANECTFCFDKPCNCVIYTCGHMCMCYECAMNVKASSDPLCPICRQEIKDVIRIYKS